MGTWEYEFLDRVPAAEHSLRRMTGLLSGPLCGWPQDRVLVFSNEPDPGRVPDRLITAFEAVTDVALFYFVGHGQISPDDQLCLGLAQSRPEPNRRAATSLRFADVRAALQGSSAAVKIVILDCCFAGLATRDALGGLGGGVLDLTAGTGAYTMAATSAYTTAWYQDDPGLAAPQTYFTKYLADLVEEGIPGQPARLRVDPVFRHVQDSLAADGRPVPHSRAVNDAREFVFAYNAAPPAAGDDCEADLVRQARLSRILVSAEQAARSITEPIVRAIALARVAQALAATELAQAEELIVEAEQTARDVPGDAVATVLMATLGIDTASSGIGRAALPATEVIAGYWSRGWVLAAVAGPMTAVDPARAERVARSIAGKDSKVVALTAVASALRGDDSTGAQRLIADAEQTARTITGQSARATALVQVAKAAAASDPARTCRLITEADRAALAAATRDSPVAVLARPAKVQAMAKARMTRYQCWKARTFADVAPALAAADPDRAAELITEACDTVHSITGEDSKGAVLASVATGLAAAAPALLAGNPSHADRLVAEAEHLAQVIIDKRVPAFVLASLARALRISDPGRASMFMTDAERAARSLTYRSQQAEALTSVAAAAAGTAQAAALLADAQGLIQDILDEGLDTSPLADSAVALAAIAPDFAESIAESIVGNSLRVWTLVRIAAAM